MRSSTSAKWRRCAARICYDHLAGAVGAGLAARCLALGWIQRQRDTRTVAITAKGRAGLRATFGIDFAGAEHS